jgi:hypothetical protein
MALGVNNAASCTDGSKMYVFGGRIGNSGVGKGFSETQVRPTMQLLSLENATRALC